MTRIWDEKLLDEFGVHHHCVPIEIFGQYACWTKPFQKVERVSYEVPTLSGMVGVLESIFWKPEFQWVIDRIDILNPIQYSTFRTKEYKNKVNTSNGPVRVDEERDLRYNRLLRDPHYRVFARPVVLESEHGVGAYIHQFRRRRDSGQFFHAPYLGIRDYRAHFKPADPDSVPIDESRDLGPVVIGQNRDHNQAVVANLSLEQGTVRFTPEHHRLIKPELAFP